VTTGLNAAGNSTNFDKSVYDIAVGHGIP